MDERSVSTSSFSFISACTSSGTCASANGTAFFSVFFISSSFFCMSARSSLKVVSSFFSTYASNFTPTPSRFFIMSFTISLMLSCRASYMLNFSSRLFMSINIFSIFEDSLSADLFISSIFSIFFATSWSTFATFSSPPMLFRSAFISPRLFIRSLTFTSSFSVRTSMSENILSRFVNSLFIFCGSISSISSFNFATFISCSFIPASLWKTFDRSSASPSVSMCMRSSDDALVSFSASSVAFSRSSSTLNFSWNFCISSCAVCDTTDCICDIDW
ncbi:Uncharacterised protein [uncultured archaeon]|nr:Uncharacterised protein [uncultured archaeon]